jgi:AraC-like DNA-binding protein
MASNTINNLTYTARELEDAGKFNRCIFTFDHTTFNAKDISLIRHNSRILNLSFKNGFELELWFEDPQHASNAYKDLINVMGDTDLEYYVQYRMERKKRQLLNLAFSTPKL